MRTAQTGSRSPGTGVGEEEHIFGADIERVEQVADKAADLQGDGVAGEDIRPAAVVGVDHVAVYDEDDVGIGPYTIGHHVDISAVGGGQHDAAGVVKEAVEIVQGTGEPVRSAFDIAGTDEIGVDVAVVSHLDIAAVGGGRVQVEAGTTA